MSKHVFDLTRKLFFRCFILLCMYAGLLACSLMPPSNTSKITAADFFPIRDNTKHSYEGYGNEYASYVIWSDYTSSDRIQYRMDNGGVTIAEVIEIGSDSVQRIFYSADTWARESYLDEAVDANSSEVLLMNPIKEGTTWVLRDGAKRTITKLNYAVTTPLGTYETIEVETQYQSDLTRQYYAKDVGLIKTEYIMGNESVTSVLSAIDGAASYKHNITFFFPLLDQEKIIGISHEVTFQTNDNTTQIIEQAYRSLMEETMPSVLSSNTHIESIKMIENDMVLVDISKAYYEELSAGSLAEGLIIQSFVNTIGQYYQVNEVIVTVGGKPYATGHFEMKENEPFRVDMTRVIYE